MSANTPPNAPGGATPPGTQDATDASDVPGNGNVADLGPDSQRYVQGLARGLAVMKAFDATHRRMRLVDVAKRSGVARAAARRSLLTLESLGYVSSDDGQFQLTPRVLELAWAYMAGESMPTLARPFLEQLTARTGESSSLTVLDGDEILYVGRSNSRTLIRIDITIGARYPAIVTPMGRVMLADLPPEERRARLDRLEIVARTPATITDRNELEAELARIASQGWAFSDQEFDIGLRSVAVPVRDPDGGLLAAMSVGWPAQAGDPVDEERVRELVAELRRSSAGLGAALSAASM